MKTALLIIDVQKGMFLPPAPAFRGEEVVARIGGLLGAARARKVPVYHVQHDGGPGDVLAHGTEGWQIHAAVAPSAGEPVTEKRYCNSFQQTDLRDRLAAEHRQGIDEHDAPSQTCGLERGGNAGGAGADDADIAGNALCLNGGIAPDDARSGCDLSRRLGIGVFRV